MLKAENTIVFFYPAKNIGGAQLLFTRISEQLIIHGYNVLILDFGDSYTQNFLQSKDLIFQHQAVSSAKKYVCKEGDMLVLSLSYIYHFKKFITPHPATKHIFWDLHPFALLELTALSKLHKEFNNKWTFSVAKKIEKKHLQRINNFLSVANKKHSLYFMCLRDFLTNKELFSLTFEPEFLPIPIDVPDNKIDIQNKKSTNNKQTKILNIGWISRLELGKIEILKLLLDDVVHFNTMHTDIQIKLHVIGDGNQLSFVRSYQKYLDENLVITGVLKNESLTEYLNNQIDIGFSMGTAALEFAARGIATVLVPSPTLKNMFKKKKHKYIWLFNSNGFDVAVEEYYTNTKTFDNIIENFETDLNNELSIKSSAYIKSAHSLPEIFDRFKAIISKTNLTYVQIEETGIYKFSVYQKTFNRLKQIIKKAVK